MAGKEIALIGEENMTEENADNRAQVRVWLRLLACTSLIGAELRRQFREEFDFTMPRFDVLAQLDYGRESDPDRGPPGRRRLHHAVAVTARPSRADRLHDGRGQEGIQADGEKTRPLAGFAACRSSERPARRIGQGTRRLEERREARDGASPRLILRHHASGAVCIPPGRGPRCRAFFRPRAARPFGACRSR